MTDLNSGFQNEGKIILWNKKMLSGSIMEDKGYEIEFKNLWFLIRPKESNP